MDRTYVVVDEVTRKVYSLPANLRVATGIAEYLRRVTGSKRFCLTPVD